MISTMRRIRTSGVEPIGKYKREIAGVGVVWLVWTAMKLNAGRVALASATAINKLGPLTRDGEDYEWTISNVGKLMLRKVDSGVQNFASFITANKYDAGPVGYNLAIRESVKISPVFASILEQDPSSAQPRLQVRGGKGGRR
jgi:hypothetical protein